MRRGSDWARQMNERRLVNLSVRPYASGEGHGAGAFWAGCGGVLDQAASAAVLCGRQFQSSSSWMRGRMFWPGEHVGEPNSRAD